MSLLRKNKPDNWIIKLLKITDRISAEKFDMERCILSVIDYISQNTDLIATDFEINYKSSRKALDGFKKELKKQKKIVCCLVGFDSNKTRTFFTIDNQMLNWTKQPNNSYVDICIQISSDLLGQRIVDTIAEKLIGGFDFNYGYITRLPWNYSPLTERKIKRGLFSISSDLNKADHAWAFHSIGVIDGFIKQIYQINYLNSSHLKNEAVNELISKNGKAEMITPEIYKWTLSPTELETLKTNDTINRISIVTPGLEFLKTDKAQIFKDKMTKKNASC